MENRVYYSKNLDGIFLAKLEEHLKEQFDGCKRIAIKIHYGEPGNKTAFVPEDIKPITDLLKKMGIDFFFYDSSVAYGSPRNNPESHKKVALEKGWGDLGEVRTDDEFVVVQKKYLSYEVAKLLVEADGVLVISHFKGHYCSGFGGAVKNLGMGALSKNSKGAIHGGGQYNYVGGCTKCGACVKACPQGFITLEDKPVFKNCYGCSNCAYVCPVGAIRPKLEYFDILLAEGSFAAASSFKKAYYVSFVKNITKNCDCESDPKQIIAQDCGFVMSEDPVALDIASYTMVVESAGEDVFLKYNFKSGVQQLDAAEKFGMGSKEYELVKLE